MTTTSPDLDQLVTPRMREQYRTEGYFLLERALSDDQLDLLRAGARYAMDKADAEMDAAGVDRLGLNVKGKRYFTDKIAHDRTELRRFLFSDLMAAVCRATLGDEAYLFWEQYVIKGGDPARTPGNETSFSWHQDSGYVHEDHEPYVTCWIALDDVTESNGSVYLLPYSRSGIRSYVKHVRDPRTNDQVCYFGSDPGDPVIVPAGSIAVFSSLVIHRSGPNHTDRMRRVYLAQYSPAPIRSKDGREPLGDNEVFLSKGHRVVTG